MVLGTRKANRVVKLIELVGTKFYTFETKRLSNMQQHRIKMTCETDPYFCDTLTEDQFQVIQNVLEAVEDPKWQRYNLADATTTQDADNYLLSFGLELYCRRRECGPAAEYFFIRLMYELMTKQDGLIRAPYMNRDLMKQKLALAAGVIYGYDTLGKQAIEATAVLVDIYYNAVGDPSLKLSKNTLRGRTEFVQQVCQTSLSNMKKAMGSPLTADQLRNLQQAMLFVNKSKICTTYNANDATNDGQLVSDD